MMQALLVVKGVHAFDGGNIGAMKATTYFIIPETTQFLQPLGIEIQKNTSRPFIRSAPFVKEKVRIINIYIQLLTIIRIFYFNKIELLKINLSLRYEAYAYELFFTKHSLLFL